MKIRFAGLILILVGALVALLFVYLPIRNPAGFMGPVRIKALVFIPLAVVAGAALLIGGPPVLAAFQARPKSRGQLTLVLSILIGSGLLTGIGYWQITTRWIPRQEVQIIRDTTNWSPTLPTRE